MSSVNVGEHAVTARAPSSSGQTTVNIGSVDHISIVAPLKGRVSLEVKEGSLVKEGDLIATQVSAAKVRCLLFSNVLVVIQICYSLVHFSFLRRSCIYMRQRAVTSDISSVTSRILTKTDLSLSSKSCKLGRTAVGGNVP